MLHILGSLAAAALFQAAQAPTTSSELWAGVDLRKDPIEARTVREWQKDGLTVRYVTYFIGTFKGRPARMAAFFGFPTGGKGLPGLLHLHGGGQRAFRNEVEFYAKRGYACLSINWGGREMEEASPEDPNTDWGAVDPTQRNVPGYFTLKPGDRTLDPFDSPRNNNWYLLTYGARRGLTFLEEQPEVDRERLGVYGHSMGGSLTVYVSGSDARVKAAAPSVGGSGFRTEDRPFLPGSKLEQPAGDVRLFNATLGFESYAPLIRAPLLWLGATNDFHGVMDDTYRTGALIPHGNVRYVFAPHLNHRFTAEAAVARPLWLDQHLRGGPPLPKTPASRLDLDTPTHVPEFRLAPEAAASVAGVHLYYSIDPDPRARFWRAAEAVRRGDEWIAELPILSVDQPLFAFANVVYAIPKQPSEPHAAPAERVLLSSSLHGASPEDLRRHGVAATDRPTALIDDFAAGWRDWYTIAADNPHHWEYATRKLSDPKWLGGAGQRLTIAVRSEKANDLVIILTRNSFRPYRDESREFVAVVRLEGSREAQTVTLDPGAFSDGAGRKLEAWTSMDILSFRAYWETKGVLLGSKSWAGPPPAFLKLSWSGGDR